MKKAYEALALMAYGLMAASSHQTRTTCNTERIPKNKCGECRYFPQKSFCRTKGISVNKNTLACKNFK